LIKKTTSFEEEIFQKLAYQEEICSIELIQSAVNTAYCSRRSAVKLLSLAESCHISAMSVSV
jgi:hypothetical protein